MKDYFRNDYVYFIEKDGKDGIFKGIKNDLKQEEKAPYMLCPVHTQKAWEEYEASLPPETSKPTDPTGPSIPTTPTTPVGPDE